MDLFCPACGYNLRGIDSLRCPECGKEVNRADLATSRIPWVHRRERGRIRAYLSTVFLGIVHPKQLAEEMLRPVSYCDAQRFRWVTVGVAFVVSVGLSAWPVSSAMRQARSIPWPVMVGLIAMGMLGLLALLIVVSGIHSYFYHPRNLPITQQNRAVALSYYACAPLALMPLPAIVAFASYVQAQFRDDLPHGTILIAFFCAVGVIAMMWLDALRVLRQTTHCGMARQVAMGIVLPLCWLAAGLFALFLPGLLLFIAVVIHSLR